MPSSLETSLLLTTRSGRLVIGSTAGSISWEESEVPEAIQADLARYNVVRSPLAGIAILGSASGQLYLYRAGCTVSLPAKVQGKIADIIPLLGYRPGEDETVPLTTVSVMVTILGRKEASIVTVDVAADTLIPTLCMIEPEQPFVITAAGICAGEAGPRIEDRRCGALQENIRQLRSGTFAS